MVVRSGHRVAQDIFYHPGEETSVCQHSHILDACFVFVGLQTYEVVVVAGHSRQAVTCAPNPDRERVCELNFSNQLALGCQADSPSYAKILPTDLPSLSAGEDWLEPL